MKSRQQRHAVRHKTECQHKAGQHPLESRHVQARVDTQRPQRDSRKLGDAHKAADEEGDRDEVKSRWRLLVQHGYACLPRGDSRMLNKALSMRIVALMCVLQAALAIPADRAHGQPVVEVPLATLS